MVRNFIRSTSALVMLTYVICHFGDHIMLLISIPLADQAHHFLIDPWRTLLGTALLSISILAHYSNALWSIYTRRSFRLARWGWWQLGLGLSIPLLLSLHLATTRFTEAEFGVVSDYSLVLLRQWVLSPWKGIAQTLLLSVVWAHAAIGIHFWLRTKRWYPRWQSSLYVFALLWPTLALAGYITAGNEILRSARQSGFVEAELAKAHLDPARLAWADRAALYIVLGHCGLIALAFAGRALRALAARRKRSIAITHSTVGQISAHPGATILETLYDHGIRHASVCGGRARCTTCRVRIVAGNESLPPPSPLESRALARIGAPEDCRLACQTRPTADVSIVPLLPVSARPVDGHGRAGFAGNEQLVTVMFVDLRGATTLGETRLPYDVLFLLDQFLLEMQNSLTATGGHFSQFTGDGLMAIFGLDEKNERGDAGARDAVHCARDMLARLERLNHRLIPDLTRPLRIGIGIHHGEAIVGPLGPPGSRILTAIGDTVNVAARLEGLSKQHDGAFIVSLRAANAAEIDMTGQHLRTATLAGRAEPMEYYAVTN